MKLRKLIALGSVLTGACVGAAELPISITTSLAGDSRYLSYGFVDDTHPIFTPAAEVSFANVFTVGAEALYASRTADCLELHPYAAIGTNYKGVEFSLTYLYERNYADADSQYWTLAVGLPDFFLEPCVSIERDVMRDDGTYVNVEVGHSFELCEHVTLRPSLAQGFGNGPRVKAYTYLDHAGLMDTLVKLELCWRISEHVELSGYVGWSDFLFDRTLRHAARNYEASGRWDESWSPLAGLSLTVTF